MTKEQLNCMQPEACRYPTCLCVTEDVWTKTNHPAPLELTDDQIRASFLAHFHSMGLTGIKIGEVIRTGPMAYSVTMEADDVEITLPPAAEPGFEVGLAEFEGLDSIMERVNKDVGADHQHMSTDFNNPPIQLRWKIEGIAYVEVEQTYKASRYNVQSLWVDPEYQNLGLGTALMKIVHHEADRCGIELWVVPQPLGEDKRESLYHFYQRLGYREMRGSGYWIRKSPTTKQE
jgi:GNAT superfamily N-acetyltransferase